MYNLLIAVVIFLSHSMVSFRNLEQNALLNVFQNNVRILIVRDILKISFILRQNKTYSGYFSCRRS